LPKCAGNKDEIFLGEEFCNTYVSGIRIHKCSLSKPNQIVLGMLNLVIACNFIEGED
jgi:hypothetical protein